MHLVQAKMRLNATKLKKYVTKWSVNDHRRNYLIYLFSLWFRLYLIHYTEILRQFLSLKDVTAPDLFLWGFLKSPIYHNKPWTLQVLKVNIEKEIPDLMLDFLRVTIQNAVKWAIEILQFNVINFAFSNKTVLFHF